jgi:hypothetical protein
LHQEDDVPWFVGLGLHLEGHVYGLDLVNSIVERAVSGECAAAIDGAAYLVSLQGNLVDSSRLQLFDKLAVYDLFFGLLLALEHIEKQYDHEAQDEPEGDVSRKLVHILWLNPFVDPGHRRGTGARLLKSSAKLSRALMTGNKQKALIRAALRSQAAAWLLKNPASASNSTAANRRWSLVRGQGRRAIQAPTASWLPVP